MDIDSNCLTAEHESKDNEEVVVKQVEEEEGEEKVSYHRIRRTLSAINSNRKRAVKFCTLNRMKRNRSYRHTLNKLSMKARIVKLNADLELEENVKPRIGKLRFKPSVSASSLKKHALTGHHNSQSASKKLRLILGSNENLLTANESTLRSGSTAFKRLKSFRLSHHTTSQKEEVISELKAETIPKMGSILKDLKENHQAAKKQKKKPSRVSSRNTN